MSDDRWSRTATQLAELEELRRPAFTEAVRAFLQPVGTERAIDVGTGTGALAFALAPWVAEVIAVDSSPELLEQARLRAADFPTVTFVEGDGTRLDVLPGTFDIAGCSRTLHHVRRPELFVAELSRVTRPSGSVLVIDQIAPGDPLVAVELDASSGRATPRTRGSFPTSTFARCSRRTASSSSGHSSWRSSATSTSTSTSPGSRASRASARPHWRRSGTTRSSAGIWPRNRPGP